jgi:hypothetical protein
MEKALIALVIFVATATVAFAQNYNTQTYGNQSYTQGPNGYSANSQTYGNQTYTQDNQGHNCTTQTYGNQTYTNCN